MVHSTLHLSNPQSNSPILYSRWTLQSFGFRNSLFTLCRSQFGDLLPNHLRTFYIVLALDKNESIIVGMSLLNGSDHDVRLEGSSGEVIEGDVGSRD